VSTARIDEDAAHDTLAQHMTRLAGDVVELDEIEKLLFVLRL
jgi:hypothetical protein